jgi:hypothetical protein
MARRLLLETYEQLDRPERRLSEESAGLFLFYAAIGFAGTVVLAGIVIGIWYYMK